MKKFLLSVAVAAFAFNVTAQEKVYFQSDFAKTWEVFKDWEGSGSNAGKSIDAFGSDNVNNYLPNIATTVKDANGKTALQYLADEGWIIFGGGVDPNPTVSNGCNFQKFYPKMGSSNKQNGITIPTIAEFGNGVENITLSFDWFPFRAGSKAGSGVYDDTELVVIVANGSDEKQFLVPTVKPEEGAKYQWYPASISLDNVTINKDTRISVRPIDAQYLPNGAVSGVHRYCINNLKVTGKESSAVSEIEVDSDAPATYYNLQGVKVVEPTNGMYIRVKGNKSEKVVIK